MLNRDFVMGVVFLIGVLAGCSDGPPTNFPPLPGEAPVPGTLYVLSLEAMGRPKSQIIFEAKVLEDPMEGKPAAILLLPKTRILFSPDHETGIPDPEFDIPGEAEIARFLEAWDEVVGEDNDQSVNGFELVQYLHHIEMPLRNLMEFFREFQTCGDLKDLLGIFEQADALTAEEGDDVQNFYVYLSKYGVTLCEFMEILKEVDMGFEELVTDLAKSRWHFTDLPNPMAFLSMREGPLPARFNQEPGVYGQNNEKSKTTYAAVSSIEKKDIFYIIKDSQAIVTSPLKIAQAVFGGDTDTSHYSGTLQARAPNIQWSFGTWLDFLLLRGYATATTNLQTEYHAKYMGDDDGQEGLYILSVSVDAADCNAGGSETLNGYVTVESNQYFTDDDTGDLYAEIIVSFTLSISGTYLTEEISQAYSIDARTGITEN